MLILFCFLACIYVSQCKIIIKDVGVATLTRGDVGMIFYVTVRNIGDSKYNVNVKMIKCCESFSESDMDCQLMDLLGGDMGLLHPNITKNISLLYPNLYLHNRKGQCLISLKYKPAKNRTLETRQKIPFDTNINETNAKPILRGYYTKREYTKCKTIDEDPLDNCEPVNCHMKYLGSRNYFNSKWKRCQKVPICIADPNKDLPDVSYLPISNMCRDLEDLISVEDLKYLEKGIVKGIWQHQSTPELAANLRCHHGTLSNETGFCVCDDGWMSAPLDKDQYEPSLSIYHMCNIEIGTWNGLNATKIKMTAIVLVIFGGLVTIFMIMLTFICHFLYKFMKSREPSQSTKRKAQSPTQTEMDNSDTSPQSRSINSFDTFTSNASLTLAADRDSKIFHKRSIVSRKSVVGGSALRIVGKLSHHSTKVTDTDVESEESEVSSSYMEQTESFLPRRSLEDDN